jgi:phosphatidylserine/phosphatidylglycerophosphate/cardiolipin synthase-like enzyme
MMTLEEVIRDAALTLPTAHVDVLASTLESFLHPSAKSRRETVGAVGAANYRARAAAIHKAWELTPASPAGPHLAAALRAAHGVAVTLRAEQAIEIAWTGPMTQEVPLRRTREILIGLAREASQALILVSFAAYRNDLLLTELAAAAERGVEVILILEDKENSKGKLSQEARDAFEELGDLVGFYVWPASKRPAIGQGVASMHAKAAIADRQVALVTSANLTGAGIADNMELGLLIRGGPIPRRLEAHFRELMASSVLESID